MAAIWKVPAPIKAITTVWRIMKGKLATCDNLARRNIVLSIDEANCVACKRYLEAADHFFFACQEMVEIWKDFLRWLGTQTTLVQNARDHFHQFSNLEKKSDRKFLAGIWCAVIWCLWKWRNDIKFNRLEWDRDKIIGKIKSRFWDWNTAFGIQVMPTDFRSWFRAAALPSSSSLRY